MGTRNLDWYALNASRAYPLDEAATLTDDAGNLLPNDVLVDCKLMFPQSAAAYAYLGGLTVTERIVTLTLLGSDVPARQTLCGVDPTDRGLFTPLAAVSLPREQIVVGRHYAVEALLPGVGGWVVFGPGVNNRRGSDDRYYRGRFSGVSQSMLSLRSARSYLDLPVTSLGRLGNGTALTGLVRLKAGSDLEIVAETAVIDGETRDVIVFRLKSTTPVGGGRNVFELYRGPCDPRPESGTCLGPVIEQINAAVPDCCGQIAINFLGCARLTPTADGHGLVIDCGVGLSDVCVGPDELPDQYGRLPNERPSECPDA